MHFLATVITGAALTASSFLGIFHNGPANPTRPFGGDQPPVASSTWPQGGQRFSTSTMMRMHSYDGAMASSTTSAATIACVGAAVATREASLDSAEATLTSALTSAYTTRASALASAYALTTGSAVRAAVQAAWQAFASSTKSAHQSWQSARMSAWQAFMTAAKGCKAPPSLLDGNNQSLDDSAAASAQ